MRNEKRRGRTFSSHQATWAVSSVKKNDIIVTRINFFWSRLVAKGNRGKNKVVVDNKNLYPNEVCTVTATRRAKSLIDGLPAVRLNTRSVVYWSINMVGKLQINNLYYIHRIVCSGF